MAGYSGGSAFTMPNDNNWHHFSLTKKGSTGVAQVYVDGVLRHTTTAGTINYNMGNGASLVFAQEQDCLGGCFDPGQNWWGDYDEVRVWDHVRSSAQINANLGTTLTPACPTGLLLRYEFNDCGSTVADTCGTEHATYTNPLSWDLLINDGGGISVAEAGPLTDTFTVKLTSDPGVGVAVSLASTDTAQATLSVSSLSFTSANWNTAQAVTVTVVGENLADNNPSVFAEMNGALSGGTGADGALVVAGDIVVNSYAYITADLTANTHSTVSVDSTAGFAVNMKVLIHQTQATAATAGKFEVNEIRSIGAGFVTLKRKVANSYDTGSPNLGAPASRVAQMVSIPQYTDVTVPAGNSISATPFNGQKGGIVAFMASGSVTSNGAIHANFAGFRGGDCLNPPCGTATPGRQGESYLGYGTFSQFNNANGGGGATGQDGIWGSPGAGGAGGGDGTNGGLGESRCPASANNPAYDATGGVAPSDVSGSLLLFGGGGGGGGDNDNHPQLPVGGRGGGAVILWAEQVVGTSILQSIGGDALPSPSCAAGLSGAGGGGVIWVHSPNAVNTASFDVAGGAQGITCNGNDGTCGTSFPDIGGAGGTGKIRTYVGAGSVVTAPGVPQTSGKKTVAVTVVNDDIVSQAFTAGPTFTEGSTGTYAMKLTSEPYNAVTVTLTPSAGEASTNPTTLTFAPGVWNTYQTVTISVTDNQIDEATPRTRSISHSFSSSDTAYNALANAARSFSVNDNDIAALVTTVPAGNVALTEGAADTSYNLKLATQPTADVTLTVSFTTGEAQVVGTSAFTFSSTTWSDNQAVTIRAVNDLIDESTLTVPNGFRVDPSSADTFYNALATIMRQVVITDNDVAGMVTTVPAGSISLAEGAVDTTYNLKLNSQPTADVTLTVSFTSGQALVVGTSAFTYTSTTWSNNQAVTVRALDDDIDEDTQTLINAFRIDPSSTDPFYNALSTMQRSVVITDDDTAGITTDLGAGTVSVAEGGATVEIVTRLDTEPTANVSVSYTLSTAQVTVNPGLTLTFTPGTWSTPQTATVYAIDDDQQEATYFDLTGFQQSYSSTDPKYVFAGQVRALQIGTDNDVSAINVTIPASGIIVEESKQALEYTAQLETKPYADVTVTFASSSPRAIVVPTTLTFTSTDWFVPQTMAWQAVDDLVHQGTDSSSLSITSNAPGDIYYNALPVTTRSLTVLDNDASPAWVTSGTIPASLTEGQLFTFNFHMSSAPTASTVMNLNALLAGQVNATGTSWTFDTSNFNVTRSVTIQAIQDIIAEFNEAYTFGFTGVPGDSRFTSLTLASQAINIIDDDPAGVTVATGGVLREDHGSNYTISIRLNTQSQSNVAVGFGANYQWIRDPPGNLTFTNADWSIPQTITLQAVADQIFEDDHFSFLQWDVKDAPGVYNFNYNYNLSIVDDGPVNLIVGPPITDIVQSIGYITLSEWLTIFAPYNLSHIVVSPLTNPGIFGTPPNFTWVGPTKQPTRATLNYETSLNLASTSLLETYLVFENGRRSMSRYFTITTIPIPPPDLASIAPSTGPEAGGTVVTIRGLWLGAIPSQLHNVTIHNTLCSNLVWDSQEQCHCTTAPGTGVGPVTVKTLFGPGSRPEVSFAYFGLPAVTSVTPSRIPRLVSTDLTIKGTFVGRSQSDYFSLNVAGVPCQSYIWKSLTEVICKSTPSSTPGQAGRTTINVQSGGISTTGPVLPYYVPHVNEIIPPAGPTGGGYVLTIRGSGFQYNADDTLIELDVAGIGCRNSASVKSDTEITCIAEEAPSGVSTAGPVLVTTKYSGLGTSNATFEYVGLPEIHRFEPKRGDVSGGTLVSIWGKFLGAHDDEIQVLTIAGYSCTGNITWYNSTFLTCVTVPVTGGIPTTGEIAIRTKFGGESDTVSSKNLDPPSPQQKDQFSYVIDGPTPIISLVFPRQAAIPGGTIVTIIGKNMGVELQQPHTMSMNGVPCWSTIWRDPETVLCEVPAESEVNPTGTKVTFSYVAGDVPSKPSAQVFEFVDISKLCDPPCGKHGVCVNTFCECNPGWANPPECDTPNIFVAPFVNNITTEDGGTATVEVYLLDRPSDKVEVSMGTRPRGETFIEPEKLVFTPDDFQVPRTVTVTGIDDDIRDGNTVCQLGFLPALSNDPMYDGSRPPDVTFVNHDSRPVIQQLFPPVSPLRGTNMTIVGRNFDFDVRVSLGGAFLPDGDVEVRPMRRIGTPSLLQVATGNQTVSTGNGSSTLPSTQSQYNPRSYEVRRVLIVTPPAPAGYKGLRVLNLNAGGASVAVEVFYTDDCPTEGVFGSGGDCKPCPVGAYCPGGNRIRPLPGYWNDGEDSGFVVKCDPPVSRCPGYDASVGTQDESSSLVVNTGPIGAANSMCGTGYTGKTCDSCAEGYYEVQKTCQVCPPAEGFIIFLLADLAVWSLFAVAGVALEDRENLSYVIAVILTVQTIGGLGKTVATNLPGWMRRVYEFFHLFTGEISFLRPDCTGGVPFELNFFVRLGYSLAIGLPLMLGLIGAKWYAPRKYVDYGPEYIHRRQLHFARRLSRAWKIHMTIIYLSVTTTFVSAVTCLPSPKPGESGVYYLVIDPEFRCHVGAHIFIEILAYIGIIGFTAGWPLYNFMKQRNNTPILYSDEAYQEKHDFLYESFQVKFRYYWLTEYLVSFMISINDTLLADNATAQLISMGTLFAGHALVIISFKPYRRTWENPIQLAFALSNIGFVFLSYGTKKDLFSPLVTQALVYSVVISLGVCIMVFISVATYYIFFVHTDKGIWALKEVDDEYRPVVITERWDLPSNLFKDGAFSPSYLEEHPEVPQERTLVSQAMGSVNDFGAGALNQFLSIIPAALPGTKASEEDESTASAVSEIVVDSTIGGEAHPEIRQTGFAGSAGATAVNLNDGVTLPTDHQSPNIIPRPPPGTDFFDSILGAFFSKTPSAAPPYWHNREIGTMAQVVDITGAYKDKVQALFSDTCKAELLGKGRDAAPGLNHTGLEVVRVERLENPLLWSNYAYRKFALDREFEARSTTAPEIKVSTTEHNAIAESELGASLEPNSGEVYLFHGTSAALLNTIKMGGFEERVSRNGMFGHGIYFAENTSKSDEYCAPDDNGLCYMFLARVALGTPYVGLKALNGLRRPPCEFGHTTQACDHYRYHSVYAELQSKDLPSAVLTKHREMVVYDRNQTYPEFLITYRRSGGTPAAPAAVADPAADAAPTPPPLASDP
eukprot:TRINITY_DN386_c0_g1_i3.p1 TRINITY_DN386_c0_g1~~TRINITY_DN386_c0_g1_i3.p1  ORF type:complete len:3197 (-),score=554.22 TRINITY_DN386_c0_g1_i3:84-9674(-)